ncbi:MAG TPA: MFS transporter [Ktedonobacterales bacterium]
MSDAHQSAARQSAALQQPAAPHSPADAATHAPGGSTPPPEQPVASHVLSGITRIVVVLGVIALFTDMSSEMIMPLRLLLFVQVLGTPLAVAGLIEGIAESATSVLRLVSGRLADRFGDQRWLVIAGYTVSNLSKPLLALVSNWPLALGLVLVDRSGKSVRGSPRDAMIAASVAPEQRGKAFGFHRSADTLGAAIGPLLAIAILSATGNSLRAVFAWTLVPGLLAILCAVVFLLRDPALRGRPLGVTGVTGAAKPASITTGATVGDAATPPARAWQGLGARFWLFLVIATIFALGNSSDAFLFLRTEGLESSLLAVPAVYFGFNIIYALLATPLGSLSDRFGRLPMLAVGYATFTVVYFGWTRATAPWQVWELFLLYGVYYAATEGVARAFVTDLVPKAKRGTALGWFGAATGLAALPANVLAAALWSRLGPGVTFGLGAWLGAIALGMLVAWWPWLRQNPIPWPDDPAPPKREP